MVTGGAGYIGSHLVDRCLADGHEIIVLDDLSTGSAENLAHCRDRLEFVRGDICDKALVDDLVSRSDLVFHLAAVVGVTHILSNPVRSILVNSRGAENVTESAYNHGARFVLASTSEIYGKSTKVPFKESDTRELGPTNVTRWSYSTAKALDEHLVIEYARLGFRGSIVRYFNSYGPRLSADGYGSVVGTFLGQAQRNVPLSILGDGTASRSFTFISDTVEGTYQAGIRDEAIGEVFNVGEGRETSINELARLVGEVVGRELTIEHVDPIAKFGPHFEDTLRRAPDVSKIRDLLGWSPKVNLADGLAQTWAWWQVNRPLSGA
jgi:UDP-glucose 4-epimerase